MFVSWLGFGSLEYFSDEASIIEVASCYGKIKDIEKLNNFLDSQRFSFKVSSSFKEPFSVFGCTTKLFILQFVMVSLL